MNINYTDVGAKLCDLFSGCMTSLHTFPLPCTSAVNGSAVPEVLTGSPQLPTVSASKKLLPSVATGVASSLWYEDRLATNKNYHNLENLRPYNDDRKRTDQISVCTTEMLCYQIS
jgi:hypothetical protein